MSFKSSFLRQKSNNNHFTGCPTTTKNGDEIYKNKSEVNYSWKSEIIKILWTFKIFKYSSMKNKE